MSMRDHITLPRTIIAIFVVMSVLVPTMMNIASIIRIENFMNEKNSGQLLVPTGCNPRLGAEGEDYVVGVGYNQGRKGGQRLTNDCWYSMAAWRKLFSIDETKTDQDIINQTYLALRYEQKVIPAHTAILMAIAFTLAISTFLSAAAARYIFKVRLLQDYTSPGASATVIRPSNDEWRARTPEELAQKQSNAEFAREMEDRRNSQDQWPINAYWKMYLPVILLGVVIGALVGGLTGASLGLFFTLLLGGVLKRFLDMFAGMSAGNPIAIVAFVSTVIGIVIVAIQRSQMIF